MVGPQTFTYLLALLFLLILTGGTSGGSYPSGGGGCSTNNCHESEIKPHKRYKPHKRRLKHGSRGADVKNLQKILNAHDLSPEPIVLDGVYGPTTLTAVKKFQQQANLPADGVVEAETWDKLFASASL